jgi:hypothetical protein
VVDVRMGENDSVELVHRDGKLGILARRFPAATVEHAAVERDGMSADAQQMARTGDLLGGTDELDLHCASVRRIQRALRVYPLIRRNIAGAAVPCE